VPIQWLRQGNDHLRNQWLCVLRGAYLFDLQFCSRRNSQRGQSQVSEMAFTLWTLIEAFVLLINAVAILSEERFLKPMGWGYRSANELDPENVKDKIITFLTAVRMLMRIPLIFINTAVVLMELLLG